MAKSAEAFRTISEAADEVGVPQHVLRHWEDVFGHIRPMRRAGGRRYYRPVDLDLLRGVRVLLYDERYTTKGVQKIFRDNGVKYITELGRRVATGEPLEIKREIDNNGDDRAGTSNGIADGRSATIDASSANAADSGMVTRSAEQLGQLISRLVKVQDRLDKTINSIETLIDDVDHLT